MLVKRIVWSKNNKLCKFIRYPSFLVLLFFRLVFECYSTFAILYRSLLYTSFSLLYRFNEKKVFLTYTTHIYLPILLIKNHTLFVSPPYQSHWCAQICRENWLPPLLLACLFTEKVLALPIIEFFQGLSMKVADK